MILPRIMRVMAVGLLVAITSLGLSSSASAHSYHPPVTIPPTLTPAQTAELMKKLHYWITCGEASYTQYIATGHGFACFG